MYRSFISGSPAYSESASLGSSNVMNKSDISYLKTSQAFDVLIHSGKPNSVG